MCLCRTEWQVSRTVSSELVPGYEKAGEDIRVSRMRGIFVIRQAQTGMGLQPFSDFLLLSASHGSIILKLKSFGRKYSSIPCASVSAVLPVAYISIGKKCAIFLAVFSCNGGRFGLRNGTYCNAKRAILESKTARIAACFVRFCYQNRDFRVCGPCFLTVQTCPLYLVARCQSHVFLYNIVYKIYAGWNGGSQNSVREYRGTYRHPILRTAAESSFC